MTVKIGEDEDAKTVVVDADDGIRAGVTPESLAKLRPAFDENGSTHAGQWTPTCPSPERIADYLVLLARFCFR